MGVACGLGAALFWALGFVATRHGLKAGFTPVDLLMHRFLWSGLVFLPFVFRAGWRDLCGIGWGRGMVLMVLGGPVMSLISYAGFLFVPLGHGSVIQPSCATLGGLLLATFWLKERISNARGSENPHQACALNTGPLNSAKPAFSSEPCPVSWRPVCGPPPGPARWMR